MRKNSRGAGGNRTPVHQAMNDPATTIPAVSLTQQHRRVGWPSPEGGGPRIVFPNRQQSFRLSVVFSTVILRFCCRAAMDWPRAAFLLTMSLHSPGNQAARANCSLAILLFAPFSESEQLGSHDRTTTLTSKPVSPLIDICPSDCSGVRRDHVTHPRPALPNGVISSATWQQQ